MDKLLDWLGITEALNDPEYKNAKLLKGNVLLGNRRIYLLLCGGLTALVLFSLNVMFQLLFNLGNIVMGTKGVGVIFLPSLKLIPVYIFGLLVSAAGSFYLLYKIRINFRDLNVGQKGHNRFMTQEEIAERFKEIPEKQETFEGYGGAPISRNGGCIHIDNSVLNNMIFAITRGGKTETLVIPTIDIISRAEKKASMIIPDLKGNLCNATIQHLLDRGYTVKVLDLFDYAHSNFYNPLDCIYQAYLKDDLDMAEELLMALGAIYFEDPNVKDRYWVDAPKSLFVALVLGLMEDAKNTGQHEAVFMYGLYSLLATLGRIKSEKKLKKGLDAYFDRGVMNPAYLAYTAIEFSEGKNRTSVLSICISKLDAFRRPSVGRITSKNEFDMYELGFGEKPVAYFLRLPSYTKTFNSLITIFISQAYYLNMDKAAKENFGEMLRRVRVVGDEVFNAPALPDMDNMMTVCLGAGWSFDLYAQSFLQMEKVYGKEIAQIMLDNCATIYFLASPDEGTRKKISDLCGKKTILNVTRTGERFSLNKTIGEQYEEKPIITLDELGQLREGEMIVFPTMQRKDLSGKKVKAMPIFNKEESSLLYRFEYLPEYDLKAAIPYDRLSIPPGRYKSVCLESMLLKHKALQDEAFPQDLLAEELLTDVLNSTTLNFIKNMLPDNYEVDLATMHTGEFLELLDIMLRDGDITEAVYEQIEKTIQKAP